MGGVKTARRWRHRVWAKIEQKDEETRWRMCGGDGRAQIERQYVRFWNVQRARKIAIG